MRIKKPSTKPAPMAVPPEVAFAEAPVAVSEESAATQLNQSTPATETPAAVAPETPAPAAAPRQPLHYLHFTDGTNPFRRGERLVVVNNGKLYSYTSLQISANKLEGLTTTQVPYRGQQVEGYAINREQLLKLFVMVDEFHAEQQGMERKDEEAKRAPKYNRHSTPSPTPVAPKPPSPADLIRSAIGEIERTKASVVALAEKYGRVVTDEEKEEIISSLDALRAGLEEQSVAVVVAALSGQAAQIDVAGTLAGTKAALFNVNDLINSGLSRELLKTIEESKTPEVAKKAAADGIANLLAQAKARHGNGESVDWSDVRHKMVDAKNAVLAFAPKPQRRDHNNSRGDQRPSKPRNWR